MRAFAVVCVAAIAGSALAEVQVGRLNAFKAWKALNAVSYPTLDEEVMREAIFNANLAKITAHNAKGESWTMAVNQFADMTTKEFGAAMVGGYVPRSLRRAAPALDVPVLSNPSSVDWTTKGVVTPVKNQGQCGSCWAFSTTGSIESINAINGNPLTSLSEQQLVDCSGSYGNQGCNGGLMDSAFQYVIHNGGLCTEGAYPYHATDGTCQSSSCKSAVTIASYKDVARDSDSAFENAVAKQPVSIAIEADQSSFQFYSGGVLTANCGTNLDHGVLAVGYGTMSGTQYWKVKNSWGASWGMSGYVLLARGEQYNGGKGQCGIYTTGSTPEQ